MRFKEIRHHNFRNLQDAVIRTDARDVVFEGMNGQGKTNLLESIYMLSYGSSFRTPYAKEAVRFGADDMSLSALVGMDDGDMRRIDYQLVDGKRRILLDGKEVNDRKELVYNFPVIVFCHDDIDFVRGEPERRRRFFDQTFSMYNPLYLDSLRRYRMILSQRNAAIKAGQSSLLSLYDGRLAKYGLEIVRDREEGVKNFNQIFPGLYKAISGTDKEVVIRYQPSWKELRSEDEVTSYLESTRDRDMRMLTSTSGIHRDRFTVCDENGPFSQSGSTGQVRLASVLFRLAQARFYMEMTGKEPVVLLDDVLLELDAAKRASFLSHLDSYSQAFLTFLPDERYFGSDDGGRLTYIVEDGHVRPR